MKPVRKTKPRKETGKKANTGWIQGWIKGVLAAVIFTMIAIMAFAFLLKSLGLSDTVIAPVNLVIKIAGICIAALIACRGAEAYGWLIGGFAGFTYMGLGFLLMSFLDGSFGLISILLSDLLTGAIVGVIICLLGKAMPQKKRRTAK